MRLPRHDTSLSLPAEPPREALARDEAMLDADNWAERGMPRVRWWVARTPAVVVGIGVRHRLASVVDLDRCRAAGVEVLARRAGGGALLADEGMLCGAVCVPARSLPADVTESYRWLGDELVQRLRAVGVGNARRIEVSEARADVAELRQHSDPLAGNLLSCCYGTLSPHEVAVGPAKIVGLAQVRRRQATLFQFGILLRDQSGLSEFLALTEDSVRGDLAAELGRRTAGLDRLLGLTGREASAAGAAIAGATPFEL